MTNKQEKITIFSYDCKAFLEQVKSHANDLENQNLSNSKVRAINCEICQSINNEILACMKLFAVRGGGDYDVINRGATSLCYQSINDTQQKNILKIFEPESFPLTPITPYCDIEHDLVVSYNWIDCNKADTDQEFAFLKRFVRFILQEDLITTMQTNANQKEQNLFIVPELALTTKGFAFISPHFFGNTLKERFQQYAETTTATKEEKICDSVIAVRQAAEYIQDVCHEKKIYHGDIKPSNFFDIKDGDSHLIKNIDFDTLVNFSENSFCGYKNWDVAATTPLFYYADAERVIRNQDFDKIKEYDISALSRMLAYAIICIYGEEENLYNTFNCDSSHFNWIDFFFKSSGVGERLFNDICAVSSVGDEDYSVRIKLSRLFIFEKIRSLLMRCSEKVKDTARIVDVQEFIDCSLLIEELFNHNKNDFSMLSDIGRDRSYILNGVVRHLNLLYLDAENNRNNKNLKVDYALLVNLRPSLDWVQYVIEQNYYKQGDDDYDAIDRHLIPDIDWGDGSKPLAYRFDDNGRPISSPLEQALEEVRDNSLFLTAEGGQGKTTTLRSFWLDFLSGKHTIPCLYVDLKMLDANDEEKAIRDYISNNKKGYNFSWDYTKCKPILLLDGANEADRRLRDQPATNSLHMQNCNLVEECHKLIDMGYRLVIGSRSTAVAIVCGEFRNKNEFVDVGMQFASVCELREEQIKTSMPNSYGILFQNNIVDLMHNNMMLFIIRNLDQFSVTIKDIKGGILLDYYFNVCFKTRYIKHVCSLNNMSDLEVYNLINAKTAEKNSQVVYSIKQNLRVYDKIIKQLIKNMYCFDVLDMEQWHRNKKNLLKNIDESNADVLCELALFEKKDDNKYEWANEMFQEYFEALWLKDILLSFSKNKINDKSIGAFAGFKDDHIGDYAMQFAGEILNNEVCFYETIVVELRKREELLQIPDIVFDRILKISVLCGRGFPRGIDFINGPTEDTSFIRLYNGPFFGCVNIRQLFIPEWVARVDIGAFGYCEQLERIEVDKNNKNYYSEDNCLIEISSRTLIAACKNSVIPIDSGVERIGRYAFSRVDIRNIIIPGNIKYIDNGAFYRCENLTKVVISEGVLSIGAHAFGYCENLVSIDLPATVKLIGDGVSSVPYWAISHDICYPDIFEGCKSLAHISIAPGNPIYHSSGNCLIETDSKKIIAGCQNSIIPSDGSVRRIGYNAFSRCDLSKVEIPNTISYIEYNAFDYDVLGNGDLCHDIVGSNVFDYAEYLGNHENPFYALIKASDKTKQIHKDTVVIGERAFFGNDALTSITIPRSVRYVGKSAFSCCPILIIRCEIEQKLEGWDENWLHSEHDLTVSLLNGKQETCPVIWDCLNNNKDESGNEYCLIDNIYYKIHPNYAVIWWVDNEIAGDISIKQKIEYNGKHYDVLGIAPYAFQGCRKIDSLTIPIGIEHVGMHVIDTLFDGIIYCEYKERPVGWDSKWHDGSVIVIWDCIENDKDEKGFCYTQDGNCFYRLKDGTATLYKCVDYMGGSVVIPNVVAYKNTNYVVQEISRFGFNKTINSIIISDSVERIGCDIFSGLSELTNVKFGSGISKVHEFFLYYEGMFWECDKLEQIKISRRVFMVLKKYIFFTETAKNKFIDKVKVEFED